MRHCAFLLFFGLLPSEAYAVVGDLNRNGVVDLDDFFLLADNFGKEGPVETARTARSFSFGQDTDMTGWTASADLHWEIADGQLLLTGNSDSFNAEFLYDQVFSADLDFSADIAYRSGDPNLNYS